MRTGDIAENKLVNELVWGGKLFTSFIESEAEVVKGWADELGW